MEFSNARSSRNRTEETLPWAKASQHSVSNCATKQPSVWMKSGKSDNEVIVLPAQAILLFLTLPWAVLATGRHRLGLPQVAGNPLRQRGRDGWVVSRKPGSHSSIADDTTFSLLLTKQRRGVSRAAAHLSHLFKEPKASNMDLLLAFLSNHLPTTRKTTEGCQESAVF